MSQRVAKYGLYLLVLMIVVDATRRRRRHRSAKAAHKEALMTWEHEGGAVP